MRWLPCPHLGHPVELTGEREFHIQISHPALVPGRLSEIAQTVSAPDYVGTREGREELGFVRFWPDLFGGRFVVVVVVADRDDRGVTLRYWVVTAYVARRTTTWRPQ